MSPMDHSKAERELGWQVESEQGGLQVGIGNVTFDGATEQSAHVITAQMGPMAPWPAAWGDRRRRR